MRFDVHGLDVDDDEARDVANALYQFLSEGYDVEGVAPVLVDRDRHVPSEEWLEQTSLDSPTAVVRDGRLFEVRVEEVESR